MLSTQLEGINKSSACLPNLWWYHQNMKRWRGYKWTPKQSTKYLAEILGVSGAICTEEINLGVGMHLRAQLTLPSRNDIEVAFAVLCGCLLQPLFMQHVQLPPLLMLSPLRVEDIATQVFNTVERRRDNVRLSSSFAPCSFLTTKSFLLLKRHWEKTTGRNITVTSARRCLAYT